MMQRSYLLRVRAREGHHSGSYTTYFANPFGPMQQQDIRDPIIDKVYECLKDNGVFIGEVYTTSVEIQRIESIVRVRRSF